MTQNSMSNPLVKSSIIMVSGAEAGKFLQGQLSCDVIALADGDGALGAYCNTKGRVEAIFQLWRENDDYFMRMPEELLEQTQKELHKYAVFSKVKVEIVDKDLPALNEEQEIKAGIPQVYLTTKSVFLPHDLNLPALGAVSFTKGCYRGQEIVARMQHRGKLKRSLEFFETELNAQPGDEIVLNENNGVAKVVRSYRKADKTIGLAVIRKGDLQS